MQSWPLSGILANLLLGVLMLNYYYVKNEPFSQTAFMHFHSY